MRSRGFTAIELVLVCLILGLVAAIAIPNYRASQDRAREGRVKSNMHVFQLAAEDFRVQSDSGYAQRADHVAAFLSHDFLNPFDRTHGRGLSWEDRALASDPPSEHPGIVSYADTAQGSDYSIKGYGRRRVLNLTLTGTLPDYLEGSPASGPTADDPLEERKRGGESLGPELEP